MPPLPASTHVSVKHMLLVTPSSPSLVADSVIKESFTQVKEDTNLAVLKNLCSAKGGKQLASAASSLGTCRASLASGSSAAFRFSRNSLRSRGSKRQSSSSLSRPSKLFFRGLLVLRRRLRGIFANRSYVPLLL